MQHLWNLAPFLSVKWYQVFGEVCCPHPDFILRKVTVVKIERIISSFATDTHRHQRINRRFPDNWNVLLLRRHWIPCYLAVPHFIVRRSAKCYLQLKFLVPLRNLATCNNCCTLNYWPTHWLASLLRLFQIFFPLFLIPHFSTSHHRTDSEGRFYHSNSVVTKQQKYWLEKKVRVRLTAYLGSS